MHLQTDARKGTYEDSGRRIHAEPGRKAGSRFTAEESGRIRSAVVTPLRHTIRIRGIPGYTPSRRGPGAPMLMARDTGFPFEEILFCHTSTSLLFPPS